MNALRRYGILVAGALVVGATVAAYLGVLPSVIHGRHADKVLHFLLFGLVAFFWVLRWGDAGPKLGPVRLPLAVVVPFSIAAIEESLQLLSRHRSADPVDLACDLLGLLVFRWLARAALARAGRAPARLPASGRYRFSATARPRQRWKG